MVRPEAKRHPSAKIWGQDSEDLGGGGGSQPGGKRPRKYASLESEDEKGKTQRWVLTPGKRESWDHRRPCDLAKIHLYFLKTHREGGKCFISKQVKTLGKYKRSQKFGKVDIVLPAKTTVEMRTRAQPSPRRAAIKDDVAISWNPGRTLYHPKGRAMNRRCL